MPVPNPASSGDDAPSRIVMHAAVLSCYLLVAIALMYSAWRIAATSELIDHILDQQTSILKEIKDARVDIPAEVKQQTQEVARGVAKDVAKDVMKNVGKQLFGPR